MRWTFHSVFESIQIQFSYRILSFFCQLLSPSDICLWRFCIFFPSHIPPPPPVFMCLMLYAWDINHNCTARYVLSHSFFALMLHFWIWLTIFMFSKTYISSFDKFFDVRSVLTTNDQKTSLDDPSSKHMAASVATEEREKMDEMHSLLVCPACTNTLMGLSVLDCCKFNWHERENC